MVFKTHLLVVGKIVIYHNKKSRKGGVQVCGCVHK